MDSTQNQEFWMKKCTEVLHEKEYKTKNLENYKGSQMPKKWKMKWNIVKID